MAGVGDALDPDTVERVLRRAQELSADAVDQADARPGVVDEAVLVDAAAEAGIDPGAVRQALALERLEVGLLGLVVGSGICLVGALSSIMRLRKLEPLKALKEI